MKKSETYSIPQHLQPKQKDFSFPLEEKLSSVLNIKCRIPNDAFTASILGTEREGYGVMLETDNLIVTIGYIIAEAESIWITTSTGEITQGHMVGFDYDTGFGLIQSLRPLDVPPVKISSVKALNSQNQKFMLTGSGELNNSIECNIIQIKEFAGYWEYVIEDALYTSPAHPDWGGAALFDCVGDLCGIGSLYIENFDGNKQGNLCVPTDQLSPIIPELLKCGRRAGKSRPWIGAFISMIKERFMVVGVYDGSPAAYAGLKAGDEIITIEGEKFNNLANLFKKMWSIGPAGVKIPLTICRKEKETNLIIDSADRQSVWKTPITH